MSYALIPRLGDASPAPSASPLPLSTGLWLIAAGVVTGYVYARFFKKKARRYRANASWSRAYKDRLPDSAFLYVSPGGRKQREGGKLVTVPRSKRHFPYKNLAGRVDVGHVRSAIGRIPRSGVPKSLKPKLQSKARTILSRAKI